MLNYNWIDLICMLSIHHGDQHLMELNFDETEGPGQINPSFKGLSEENETIIHCQELKLPAMYRRLH